MTDTPLQAEDAAQRLCTELRALAQEYQAPLTPTILREESQLTFSDLIEEFGSVASGTIEAGVDYYNPGAKHDPITVLGEDWSTESKIDQLQAPRMTLLADIRQDIKLWESIDRAYSHSTTIATSTDEFGTWDAAVIETGVVDQDTEEWTLTTEYVSYIQRIAYELGRPPTEDYRALRPNEKAAILRRFGTWDSALRAAGLQPADQDRQFEFAIHLRNLAAQVGHSPNKAEIQAYKQDIGEYGLPDVECFEAAFETIEAAWDYAGLPAERDLHHESELQLDASVDGIPSHNDLLHELFRVLWGWTSGQTLETVYDQRGMIDKRHFRIQFGSLDAAFEMLLLSEEDSTE